MFTDSLQDNSDYFNVCCTCGIQELFYCVI